jgi:hypothetical protein
MDEIDQIIEDKKELLYEVKALGIQEANRGRICKTCGMMFCKLYGYGYVADYSCWVPIGFIKVWKEEAL